MTEDIPYRQHKQDAQVMFAIIKKKYPKKPERMLTPMISLWKICKGCWAHDPKRRLKIREIVYQLSLISSVVQERAIVRLSPTGKHITNSTPSSSKKISQSTGSEDVPRANMNANVFPISRPSQRTRNMTRSCQEVYNLVIVKNVPLNNALKCNRWGNLQFECNLRSPCSNCLKKGIAERCVYLNPDKRQRHVFISQNFYVSIPDDRTIFVYVQRQEEHRPD